MSMPSTWIAPADGSSRPSSIEMVVVLPAPLPPSSPSTAPRGTVNVRSSTATTSPYTLRRCRTSMEGVSATPSQRLHRGFDAIEALAELFGPRGEAEADIALSARPEGLARRQADLVLLRQLLAEGERVAHTVDLEEGIESCFGTRELDPRQARQALEHQLAP